MRRETYTNVEVVLEGQGWVHTRTGVDVSPEVRGTPATPFAPTYWHRAPVAGVCTVFPES